MFFSRTTPHIVVHHRSKPTDWLMAFAVAGAAVGTVFVGEQIKNRLDVLLRKVASPADIAKVAVADKASALRPKNILARLKGRFAKKED